ncbi:hypothetical protein [Rhizobium grahamii]|uniref:Uncharacterized protein n=1 Tax=Rhizobium grahamii CCGE 502 TaxID=990285 RepID=S3I2V5_9HYPH|nr:hypothetical protein [Rhizobium grahamii]EPE99516.1 hypothetical protein RGCCGE502_05015 [Rhizobium grahamii CCGE 502]
MSQFLRPEIDDCENDAERANWLLTSPIDCLIRDENFIRMVLRGTHFHAGLAYLEAELSHLREPRREDGWPVQILAIAAARGRLKRIASGATLKSEANP